MNVRREQMNQGDWVRSFAHRHLRRAALYSKAEKIAITPGIPLRPQETLIGVYSNSPDSLIGAIGITDCGLHIASETQWRWVAYDDICEVCFPVTHKEDPCLSEYLDIELRDGEK